jgi:hypothetical protein
MRMRMRHGRIATLNGGVIDEEECGDEERGRV